MEPVMAEPRQHAFEIQRKYSDLFQEPGFKTSDIAKLMGLTIRQVEDLPQEAALIWKRSGTGAQILVRKNLPTNQARIAVAHELGHAVLMLADRWVDQTCSLEWREHFAQDFAMELLIPECKRSQLRERFLALTIASELLDLAAELRLSPGHVLRFAMSQENWFDRLRTLWYRVRYQPHRDTGQDVRLRIDKSYYDRECFYVPRNKSFAGYFGADTMLQGLLKGPDVVKHVCLEIDHHNSTGFPKYPRIQHEASVSAIQTKAEKSVDTVQYFVCVVLRH